MLKLGIVTPDSIRLEWNGYVHLSGMEWICPPKRNGVDMSTLVEWNGYVHLSGMEWICPPKWNGMDKST